MWQSLKISNVFNTLTLKQIFWKTKTFFRKLEYRFLFESNNTENTSFPYKTAISEANVKKNKMVIAKWTYQKERSFAVTTLFFWKFCSSLRAFYIELICRTNNPKSDIGTFWKPWSFVWRCFFPMNILNLLTRCGNKRWYILA